MSNKMRKSGTKRDSAASGANTTPPWPASPALLQRYKVNDHERESFERVKAQLESALAAVNEILKPDFLTDETRGVRVVKARTFGDFQATHPKVYVGHGERESWEALLARYGWDPMHEACGEVVKMSRYERAFLSMMTDWLDKNYKVEDGA